MTCAPFLLSLPLLAAQAAPVKDLVEVRLRGPSEASWLFQVATDPLDEVPITPDGRALVLAGDAEQAFLAALGFRLRVLQEDLAGFYAARAAADPGSRAAGGSMGGFRTWAEILQEMDRLAATYPNLVSPRFSIGTSIEGRPIWAMRLSDNPTVSEPGEPVAWFDALHHAREPMSGESVLLFADWLCQRHGSGALATRLLESRDILIMPCANPDGYEYNRQIAPNGGGLWRKNRRNNGGGSFGVDLNRNYGWEWGPQWPGSSGDPNSEIYRGTAPFSEPETRAFRDALAVKPPGMSVSAHTYSNLWIYSWGYSTYYTPENSIFRYYGQRMTEENGWPYGTSWEVLYIANGVSIDWHYGTHGTYAFTPEIGGDGDGFWPAPSRIPALFEAVLPAYLMVAMWTGSYAERTDAAYSQVLGDGDPWMEPGETWDVALTYGNAGRSAVSLSLELRSPTPDVVVEVGSSSVTVPVRGSATAPALRVRFASGAQAGVPYDLELRETWDGVTTSEALTLVLGQPRVLGHDDMELADFGWSVSNQTNWSWERAAPQRTTSSGQTVQPGNDNPASSGTLCWVTGAAAGSSAGANDVDGTTRLTSPLFRASGFAHLELEYARWFANLPGSALDDELVVEASGDGGATWTRLEATPNANSWRTVRFDLEDFVPLTERMRLRFTAADEPNNDLTEGLLDDVYLRAVSELPSLGAWGEVALGASVRLFVDGPPSVSYKVLWSFTSGPGVPVPGIEGLYYLTGRVRELLRGTANASGLVDLLVTVPNNPALAGRTVYLQALLDEGGPEAAYSNLLTLVVSP